MYLQYFLTIFASFLILIKSEDVMPPSGRSYYQLQHPNKGKLSFTLNFLTFSSSYRDSSLVFVVGSEKHCMFQLKLVSNVNSAIILLKKYGDYEGEEKRVDLKDVDEKVEVSYFDDKFFLNETEVLMKCGVEWMPLDRKTDMIDILIDNAEANPAYVNIVWGDYIKYYDPNPNSTEPEETTANSENPNSTKKFIATTTPKLTVTTPKKTEETADASVGLIVGISVGGFILGCIIGVGSIVAYLYFMKKQSKSKSNVKTVVTSKSITAPLRQDELDAK